MYYEVTHNGDKGETYLDTYLKIDNIVFSDDDMVTYDPDLVETQTLDVMHAGIHESHVMRSISDVPYVCVNCHVCLCHDPSGLLAEACVPKEVLQEG